MADDRERWALILGASSGMGEATAIALAEAGYNIVGIHLDFRAALAHVAEVKARIGEHGRNAVFINMNAADDEKRAGAIEAIRAQFDERRAAGVSPHLRVVMHSLAFGSLLPLLDADPKRAISRKQLEMTLDVMANSLVYWVQDLSRAGLLETGSKVYAMTSEGSTRVVPTYGAVSAAKAALESHSRQLAMELARSGSGVTVNAIRAGVTVTPALMKIPEHEQIIEASVRRNPTGRMTTPQDVAAAIVALSDQGLDFMTGNVIGIDGGEYITRVAGCRPRAGRPARAPLAGPGRGRLIAVGSVNVDMVVRVGRLPDHGETVSDGTFERHHGGKGANQAVAAARLGARVEFVGAVGDDDLGT